MADRNTHQQDREQWRARILRALAELRSDAQVGSRGSSNGDLAASSSRDATSRAPQRASAG